MSVQWNQRPDSSEYAEYFQRYIREVPDGDILQILQQQGAETAEFFGSIPAETQESRYAEGKWSIKEVFGHIIDTERILCYRALCIARGESQRLPGYDEDEYVANANFDDQSMSDLCEQYQSVRAATIGQFRSFSPEMLARAGNHSNTKYSFNVRAAAWLLAGHTVHHCRVVRERYL